MTTLAAEWAHVIEPLKAAGVPAYVAHTGGGIWLLACDGPADSSVWAGLSDDAGLGDVADHLAGACWVLLLGCDALPEGLLVETMAKRDDVEQLVTILVAAHRQWNHGGVRDALSSP